MALLRAFSAPEKTSRRFIREMLLLNKGALTCNRLTPWRQAARKGQGTESCEGRAIRSSTSEGWCGRTESNRRFYSPASEVRIYLVIRFLMDVVDTDVRYDSIMTYGERAS